MSRGARLGLATLLLLGAAAIFFGTSFNDRTEREFCAQLYAKSADSADSARVDRSRPVSGRERLRRSANSLTCGELRHAQK